LREVAQRIAILPVRPNQGSQRRSAADSCICSLLNISFLQ
jgi:hypothetical protein